MFQSHLARLKGYTPGEQPRTDDFIKLNTNECPYPPSPRVIEAITEATKRLRKYPDPDATSFLEAAAELIGVAPDQIVATNGSDEALTLLARMCCGINDLMVAPTPSYLLYKVLADIQGCRFEERAFDSTGGLSDDFSKGSKLAFVPNPNSPTGTMIPPRRLLELAKHSDGLFVVDEAYADFAETNCVNLVNETDRLVVLRTLSKSYALAGLRFGYAVAPPEVASMLRRVKDSYNCDVLSIAAATAAIKDQEYLNETVQKIKSTRNRIEQSLIGMGFDVTRSSANFVWFRRKEPLKPLFESLAERKILVRYFNYPDFGEGIRVSVGTNEETDAFLEAVRSLV